MYINELNKKITILLEEVQLADEGDPEWYGDHYQADNEKDIKEFVKNLKPNDSLGFAVKETVFDVSNYIEYTIKKDSNDKYTIIEDVINGNRTETENMSLQQVLYKLDNYILINDEIVHNEVVKVGHYA